MISFAVNVEQMWKKVIDMRCIDENAVIKMLNTMDRYTSEELTLCDTDKTFPKNEVFIVDDVYEGLDELPTIKPVRRGKWIPMVVSGGRDSWKCSVCGRRARGKIENLPYCHCGAKMEEGEQDG